MFLCLSAERWRGAGGNLSSAPASFLAACLVWANKTSRCRGRPAGNASHMWVEPSEVDFFLWLFTGSRLKLHDTPKPPKLHWDKWHFMHAQEKPRLATWFTVIGWQTFFYFILHKMFSFSLQNTFPNFGFLLRMHSVLFCGGQPATCEVLVAESS